MTAAIIILMWVLNIFFVWNYIKRSWPNQNTTAILFKALASVICLLYATILCILNGTYGTPSTLMLFAFLCNCISDLFIALVPLIPAHTPNKRAHTRKLIYLGVAVLFYFASMVLFCTAFFLALHQGGYSFVLWEYLLPVVLFIVLCLLLRYVMKIDVIAALKERKYMIAPMCIFMIAIIFSFTAILIFGIEVIPFSVMGGLTAIIGAIVYAASSVLLGLRTLTLAQNDTKLIRTISIAAYYAAQMFLAGTLLVLH